MKSPIHYTLSAKLHPSVASFLTRAPLLATLFMVAPLAQAQNLWLGEDGTGGDGAFSVTDHWRNGVVPNGTSAGASPAYNNRAAFFLTTTATSASSNVTLSGDVLVNQLDVGYGKTVDFELEDEATLTIGTLSVFGATAGRLPNIPAGDITGTGAAHTTFSVAAGGSATINASAISLGQGSGTPIVGTQGNRLTFSGNLVVKETGTVSTRVGNVGNYNTISVLKGAHVTRVGVDFTTVNALVGNRLVVSGMESHGRSTLVIEGRTTNANDNGLNIGWASSGTNGSEENGLIVEEGGLVQLKAAESAGARAGILRVGVRDYAKSNYATITGAESRVELLDHAALHIGNASRTNLGGNYVEILEGGSALVTGAVVINGYNSGSADAAGENRLTIGDGGTFSATSTLITHGLLQLQKGGVLDGGTESLAVTVASGGRFEAAGAGLGANVDTTIESGGELEVGLTGATEGSVLSLTSEINFQSGSMLTLGFYGASDADQIDLLADGALSGDVILNLFLQGYTPEAGESWTLFTGEIANVDVTLDLSAIDLAIWDISNLNEAGGWRVVAIPEPGSMVLMGLFGSAALLLCARKRRAVS